MRQITKAQKLKIYFNTAPFMLGEGFCIGGTIIPIIAYPKPEGLFGLIVLGIGVFVINKKIQTMKTGFFVLKHGLKTEAKITQVRNTSWEHNGRTVKEYNFQFEAGGKKFNYTYRSAYKRQLELGSKMLLFYIKSNPELSFIPKLYNLDIN